MVQHSRVERRRRGLALATATALAVVATVVAGTPAHANAVSDFTLTWQAYPAADAVGTN